MANTKTAYTQFREKAAEYQRYSGIAKQVQANQVVTGIHNIAAEILRKRGLEDLASDTEHSDAIPNNHALYPLMQQGVEDSQKEFNKFGKNHLVSIVNSKDLDREIVARALLMLSPEDDIKGYEALSKMHRSAAEFYVDLYLYQQDGKLSPAQKAQVMQNMKARVSNHYAKKFKDDKTFAARLGAFIVGYDNIAVAQCKTITEAMVKDFTTVLDNSNAGRYVQAMNLPDEKMDIFYRAILNGSKDE